MMKKGAAAVIIVVLLMLIYHLQSGKVNDAVVSIEYSSTFTSEEIEGAVGTVKKKFREFQGCELTDLKYSETYSKRKAEEYLTYGGGTGKGLTSENVIVLLSTFTVGFSGGDGSFDPHSIQSDWNWILVREKKGGKWRVADWGY
ncbi:DUF4829 domain-containing protein [Bacillus lacus]|uniref:DUF4829 domain-containing protein n=1 Tax=Metabacillus lacus TaxID=1983721 RepID=A0A7X2J1P6_9BACI|nr:DUF4829 domain-containing protein [Metabacillus lacus]MRX73833.1 DUF4829 domain-containing protein [Metabacillus lacus]